MNESYTSLIGMDMASKDKVNFVFHKPLLKHDSHALSFHVVVVVAVVKWGMHQHYQPRCLTLVHLL